MLPYVLQFALFALAFAFTLAMQEPVRERSGLALRPQRPDVPAQTRPAFLLAALGVLSSWSIAGLTLALGPQMLGVLFHSSDHLVGGLGVFALTGSAAVAQLAARRTAPWQAAAGGSVVLAIGLLGIVAASAAGSGPGFLVANVITGIGFGIAFLGALRALSAAMPADRRSSVMSAFYIVAYLSLSLPAIVAGLLVGPLGLVSTFELFGAAVAAIALGVAALAWRTRPASAKRGGARPRTLEQPGRHNVTGPAPSR